MRILYYNEGENPAEWLPKLAAALPEADIRLWREGDSDPADYALVWHPPEALFRNRTGLKAIFNLAAGVDSLLSLSHVIPAGVPIFRLEDAGMAIQMAEYVTHSVLRYFRRFDEYDRQARNGIWETLEPYQREDFTVGIMGMGIMGTAVAQALKPFGFPIRGWSRHKKIMTDVDGYFGRDQLSAFLKNVRILVCLLPLTAETTGILNLDLFRQLQRGAYLINAGRGAHLIDNDLLDALKSGMLRAATLDVTSKEPLPHDHPFWNNDNITITPHIGALTICRETVEQVASYVHAFERGETLTSEVNRQKGY
ncbi:2-hydroxyacid dehydrogenase [Oxalobacter paraformigenes]|uniref:D-isomer specific 2-hydroxyacid dehydrogenase NAD-binding domain-containing protein n=1 Tax=Oxalobacter paraformigenes TaxID=556268 RepID=C3X5E4_9BURK|nr:glyoxylate/hydroxypyruvate reductase A [Oxalobacter paraformigenes]EEO28430.1 hypothetical protein OFAG_01583 [Oxalobacter paraformigenes]